MAVQGGDARGTRSNRALGARRRRTATRRTSNNNTIGNDTTNGAINRFFVSTHSFAAIFPLLILLILLTQSSSQNFHQQLQQQQYQQAGSGGLGAQSYVPPSLNAIDDLQRLSLVHQQRQHQALANKVLPPVQLRPNVRVNIRDWTKRISDDIRLVSDRTSCTRKIGAYYENEGKFHQLDPIKLRESILNQTNLLLAQHKAAVNSIVMEAERAAMAHQFIKNLTVNYTDVHRVRNEQELQSVSSVYSSNYYYFNNYNLQEYPNDYTTNQYGPSTSSGSGDKPQFTSISGGTPVPGPVEWQTPVRSIAMHINRNFGEIPVNTSMSAVHLPLPVYPGLPEIMNGIAWSERLDAVFRKNLAQFAHVHHQYYGDTLGFMRTFPAHKWRIPRNEPDLFDARTRPWYIAGAATPKDVVVLVDSSGSMTGLRREIAKGVVFEILDTLTINDHFTVLRFSETVTPMGLPKCNLKTPRFSAQLREQCRSASSGSGSQMMSAVQRNLAGMTQAAMHHLDLPYLMSQDAGNSRRGPEQQSVECASWRRQWEGRGQYLKDHPSVALSNNGSYMSDESYDQSIVNVTLDIRDAYLLPATSRNVRYLKSNFSMPTAGIANFTRALMAGFELLQAYNRTNDMGSQCNQAIMLITDGAIKSHMDVFNRYNYPGSPIRVFTYMIGREVGDIRPTKEMACRNRGYYTHVINLSEVREQVQKYLPVMARPLVLSQHHPITWTNAYGDETHQVLTDWVLEIKRRERARLMLNEERERLNEASSGDHIDTETTGIAEYDELPQVDEVLRNRIICEDGEDEAMDQSLQDEIDPLGYNDLGCHWALRRADLLTSVVKPVFDLRNTSIFFERVLSKNVWQEREIHLRNAQLLGVASVDLRIADIIKAAPSHALGPNGYSIMLGQNGFVMHHPNFHALLEDPFDKQSKILKPYFNSLDLTHIEQVYHKNESDPIRRANNEMKLLKLREASMKRATGTESMLVKRTVDCRRRPHIRAQTFYYGPIRDTPYTFMLALPDSYGLNRVTAKMALDRDSYSYLRPSEYDLWTVHPDYRYCERLGGGGGAAPIAGSASGVGGAGTISVLGRAGSGGGTSQQLHLNDSLSTLIEILNATAQGEAYELEYEDLSQISGPSRSGTSGDLLKTANYNSKFPYSSASQQKQQQQQQQTARYVCDKELFASLLFDAKATYESFVSTSSGRTNEDGSCAQTSEEMRTKLAQIYGLEMSFVATRSGLTRTLVFDESPRIKKLAKLFIERHDKAVDEAWYARTVDWNMRFNDEATIITVPYNAYIRLVAKLRQRITQRHPAVNDTRANCDPSLVEDSRAEEDNNQESSSSEQPATEAAGQGDTSGTGTEVVGGGEQNNQMGTTIESTSGVIKIMNSNLQQSLVDDGPNRATGDNEVQGDRDRTTSASSQVAASSMSIMMQNDQPQEVPVDNSVKGTGGVVVDAAGTQFNSEQQDQQVAAGAADATIINVVPPTDTTTATSASGNESAASGDQVAAGVPKINYHEYTSFDFLDLIANSSVHITATQSVIVNKSKRQHRTPVAVTGHLYDYATFARKFLNSTSLNIKTYADSGRGAQSEGLADGGGGQPPAKVDICPDGECPTRCGVRNDTIDCLLVDNNGYIVVGEELSYIGRSLADFDDRLMQSLVDKKVFHQVLITDYQAICQDLRLNATTLPGTGSIAASALASASASATGIATAAAQLVSSGQLSSASSSSSSASLTAGSNVIKPLQSLSVAQTVLANFASALIWTVSTLYSALFLQSVRISPDELFASESLLGRLHQWQRSAIMADAQSAMANQSLLAMLPNKTFLRPCERPLVLYETRPHDPAKVYDDTPEYYMTKCGCSAWYVYDAVPKTNLIMLIVNTTSACRRCEPVAPPSSSLTPPLADYTVPVSAPPPTRGAPVDQAASLGALAGGGSSGGSSGLNSAPPVVTRSTAEDQVCLMLERDSQLYLQKPSSCLASHPEEANIHICGAASRALPPVGLVVQLVISITIAMVATLLSQSQFERLQM